MTFKNPGIISVGASDGDVIEAPAGVQLGVKVSVSNTANAARALTLKMFDYSTATTTTFISAMSFAANTAFPDPFVFTLEPGDKLTAVGDDTGLRLAVAAADIDTTGGASALVPMAAYASGTTYATNEVVSDAGTSYISLQDDNVGHTPASSPSWWMVLAAKGEPGADGADGANGADGADGLGSVNGPATSTDGHFALFDGTTGQLLKDGPAVGGAASLSVGTSAGTVAAGDDSRITGAAQKTSNLSDLTSAAAARANLLLGTAAVLDIDTDGTLAANSDTKIPTQKAVKTYADALIAANDAMVFKGVIDCSASPDYPAADRGATYRVSVAGKVGGASGVNVEAGDLLLCLTDSTASGNQATVGAAWTVVQVNLDGAVIGPASATDNRIAVFDTTTGKLLKDGGKTIAELATLLSPTFTGTPAAPTAAVDTNTTQVATTAFVVAQAASATPIIDGTAAVGTSTRFARGDHVHPTDTSRAALASPTFTGAPAAPTASAGTNTTQVATTAFARNEAISPASAVNYAATQTIASASTCDIGAATSNAIIVSGTTTITALGTITAGATRDVTFSGALTLTHNGTSLILPGAANITTVAGDCATFTSLGSGNWRCTKYTRAAGIPLNGKAAGSDVRTGTDDAKAVTAKALADSAASQTLTDGATISWNMANGYNAKVTLGGSRTLATPTNPIEGITYCLDVYQDGTGSRGLTLPSSSIFDFGAEGAPTLSTGASKRDAIYARCVSTSGPVFECTFKKAS